MSNITDKHQGRKPDPEKIAFLRALPLEIKQQLTGEETEAFMFDEELPAALLEKLKDYLIDEDK
jgi:hypothetical protein